MGEQRYAAGKATHHDCKLIGGSSVQRGRIKDGLNPIAGRGAKVQDDRDEQQTGAHCAPIREDIQVIRMRIAGPPLKVSGAVCPKALVKMARPTAPERVVAPHMIGPGPERAPHIETGGRIVATNALQSFRELVRFEFPGQPGDEQKDQ